LGDAVHVHEAPAVLLLPCTYLGGASQRPTPPVLTSAVLIRAGQLPRPRAGGGLPVLSRGLGWLLQLTQVQSLCIPKPALQRHACCYHCVRFRGEEETMLGSYLLLAARDLPRGRCWGDGRAGCSPGFSTHLRSLLLVSLASLDSMMMSRPVLAFTPAFQTHSAVSPAE
jgi:hypothetical protein